MRAGIASSSSSFRKQDSGSRRPAKENGGGSKTSSVRKAEKVLKERERRERHARKSDDDGRKSSSDSDWNGAERKLHAIEEVDSRRASFDFAARKDRKVKTVPSRDSHDAPIRASPELTSKKTLNVDQIKARMKHVRGWTRALTLKLTHHFSLADSPQARRHCDNRLPLESQTRLVRF
jgi:hypothetical protein